MAQNLLELFVSVALRGEKTTIAGLKALEVQGQKTEDRLNNIANGMPAEAKKAEASSGRIQKTLGALERKAKDVSNQAVSLKMDLKGAGEVTMGLEAIKNRRDSLDRGKITLSTTLKGASEVIGELGTLEGVTSRIDGDKVLLTADVDGTEQSKAGLLSLQSVASRIDGDNLRMKVDVDGAPQAIGELAAINSVADKVDGRNVNLQTGSGVSALEALGSAIDGVATRMRSLQQVGTAAIIPGFVAAIGAIPAIATPAVASLGALTGAIGAGLAGAAAVGGGAAVAFGGALGLIIAPISGLIGKLTDYAKGTEAAAAAQEQVSSKTKAYQDALDQVESSESAADTARQTLTRTTEATARAQTELNDAMEDEPDNLGQNELDLDKARDSLGDSTRALNEAVAEYGPNSEQATDAALDLRQAELNLSQQTRDTQRVRERGSNQMVSALTAEEQAAQAQQDAQKGLTDANLKVAQATKNAAQAFTEIAAAEQKAAAEIPPLTRAQLALYNTFLKFKAVAGDAFLPAQDQTARLGQQILNLAGSYMPRLGKASLATMQALTRVFGTFRTELSRPIEQASFNRFLRTIPSFTEVAGNAFVKFSLAMLNFFARTLPYVMRFVGALDRGAQSFLNFTRSASGMAAIDRFLAYTTRKSVELWTATKNLAVGFFGLYSAMDQAGMVNQVWGGFLRLTRQFRDLTARGTESRGMVVDFFTASKPVLTALWSLLGGLVTQWFRVANAVMTMRNEAGKLVLPQALKDIQAALPIIGDMLIAAFRNFGPYIGPIIQGIAELLKYYIALNPVLIKITQGLAWLLTKFRGLSHGTKQAIASVVSLRLAFAIVGPVIMALFSPITRVVGGLALMSGRLGMAAGRAGKAGVAARVLGVALRFMMGPVGIVITAVAALAAGFIYLYRNNNTFKRAVDQTAIALKSRVMPVIRQVAQFFRQLLAPAIQFAQKQMQFVARWWKQNLPLMQRAAKTVFNLIKLAVTTNLKIVFAVIKAVVGGIVRYWQANWTEIKNILVAVWEIVKSVVRTAIRNVLNLLKLGMQVITGDWRGAWRTVKTILSDNWQNIKTIVRNALKILANVIKLTWNSIKGLTLAAFNAVRDYIGDKINTAKERAVLTLKVMGQAMFDRYENMKQSAKAAFEAIKGFMVDPIESAYDGIKDWVGKILGVVNTVLKAVGLDEIKLGSGTESPGGNGSSGRGSRPARVARFAKGGVAREHRTNRFARGGLGTSGRKPRTHMWNEQLGNEAFIAEREPSKTQMPYLKAAANWHDMDVVPRRSSVPSHRGGPDGTEENPKVHKHARGGISGLVRAFAYGGFGKEYFNSAASALDQAVMSRFPVDGSSYSGHPAGAVDFLVSSGQAQGQEKALGDSVAGWLDSNYNALNLRALIWYARARYEGGAWQPYVDNYGGGSGDVASQMHYNHPHAESLSGSFGKLNEDQTKGFTGGGGGSGGGGGFNPLVGIFNAAWDKLVQPVVDTFLKPLKASNYVMNNAVGAAAQKVPDGIKEWILGKLGPGTGGSTQDPGQGGDNRAIGERMLKASGVPGKFDSLDQLWTKESQWDHTAQNPTSTASGIPQFLDATWQQYGGKETEPTPQIDKGLQYIRDRYGGTDAAWQHSQANNWYADGGMTNGPQQAVLGEAGPELVLPLSSARVMQSAQTALGVDQLHEEVRGMREDMRNLRVHVRDFDSPATNKLIVAQEHTTKRVIKGRDGLNATKKHQSSIDKVLDLSGRH